MAGKRFQFVIGLLLTIGVPALGADNRVTTVEIGERKLLQAEMHDPEATRSDGSVLSLALSSDGKYLATGGTLSGANPASFGDLLVKAVTGRIATGGVQLREAPTRQLKSSVHGLQTTVQQVVFSPDGETLAIACGDWSTSGQVILLDTATGQVRNRLNGHSGWVNALAFSPDGRQIVSCGTTTPRSQVEGGELWRWTIPDGEGRLLWKDEEITFMSVAFAPDGRQFATGGGIPHAPATARESGLVRVWEADTGQVKFEVNDHPAIVEQVAFSPDGNLLVSASTGWGLVPPFRFDALLKFWNAATGDSVQSVNVTEWWTERRIIRFGELAFSPDGKLLAVPMGSWNRGGKWGELRLWNVERHALESEIPLAADDHHPVTAAVFSPDGKVLTASCGDGALMQWNVEAE